MYRFFILLLSFLSLFSPFVHAEETELDLLRPATDLLPPPTSLRTASGAPGKDYWQQQSDHEIDVTIDEKNLELKASEIITYHNNSPDKLDYLWLELGPNVFSKKSENELTETVTSNQITATDLSHFKPTDYQKELYTQ